jgi:hypothetical protein
MDDLGVLRTAELGSGRILDALERLLDVGEVELVDEVLESRRKELEEAKYKLNDLDHDFITGERLKPRELEPIPGGQDSMRPWGFELGTKEEKFDGDWLFRVREEDFMENARDEERGVSPARERAMMNQRARGNSPDETRPDDDVKFDHRGGYRTGLRYRMWLVLGIERGWTKDRVS